MWEMHREANEMEPQVKKISKGIREMRVRPVSQYDNRRHIFSDNVLYKFWLRNIERYSSSIEMTYLQYFLFPMHFPHLLVKNLFSIRLYFSSGITH
jgi:hypothetical protein